MKTTRFFLRLVALLGLGGLAGTAARAQTTFYFTPSSTVDGYEWNLVDFNDDLNSFWATSSAPDDPVAWVNAANNIAIFNTNPPDTPPEAIQAGPVKVVANVEAGTIRFEDDGWSLGANGGSVKVGTVYVENAATAVFEVAINNSGAALAKTGGGTLTLSGSNSYGTVTVTAGTLRLEAVAALPTSSPVVLNGGTLQVGVTGTFGTTGSTNTLTLDASSTLDFGSGLGATTVSFSNSSGMAWAGATLTILNYNSANDQLRFGTDNTGLTGTQLGKLSFSGYSGTPTLDPSGFITGLVAIPEPSTYAAITGALALGVAAIRRRRKSPGASR